MSLLPNPLQPEQILNDWQDWGEGISQQPTLLSILGNGLTNQSYLLDSSIGKLVLRVNNPNSADLGINREREALILEQLHHLRVGPEIIQQCTEYNYLLYRFIEGRVWTQADIGDKQNQQQLKKVIARYQGIQLPTLKPRDYKQYLLHYWHQLEEQGLVNCELKQQWSVFLPKLDQSNWTSCLTHHDLTPENIIETTEGLRIIDWEYAHLGHPDLDWTLINGIKDSQASDLIYWMNQLWHLLAEAS